MARSRLSTFVFLLVAFAALVAAPPTSADRGGTFAEPLDALAPTSARDEGAHTITWWCVDLNALWHVDVPVIVGPGVVIPPPVPPFPPCTTTTFPILVPAGSGWTGGGASIWFMHTDYTPEIRAALEATGYHFVSNSPTEDLMRKMAEVRYVVRDFATNTVVAEESFDPRQNFRLVRSREYFGELPLTPIVVPELGLDIDAEAMGRLPLVHFPAVGGGLPPGQYRVQVYWVFSELHNDGLGLDPGNFVPPGAWLRGQPMFVVVP